MMHEKRVAKHHEKNGVASFLPSGLSFLGRVGELGDGCRILGVKV